jgi:protein SCO1/2
MKLPFQVMLPLLLIALILAALPADPARAEVRYKRSVEKYNIPDVVLINQDGKKVRIASLLNSGDPVIVDFIYGTCTTICPVLSAGMVNLQRKLGPLSQKVRLISITIDPEHDSPKILKDYLKRYRAQPGWDFLTGSRADIDAVMKAFNAYIPDKMSHYPINLIRDPRDGSWVRIFGLMSSKEFLAEYQQVATPSVSGLKP